MKSYDLTRVTITFRGETLPGPFAESDCIAWSFNEDMWTFTPGAAGSGARSKNNNRSGKFTLTLQASSAGNTILSAIYALDDAGNTGSGEFLVEDNSDGSTVAKAESAWIVKMPDGKRAKTVGDVEWIFETDRLEVTHGDLEDDE